MIAYLYNFIENYPFLSLIILWLGINALFVVAWTGLQFFTVTN